MVWLVFGFFSLPFNLLGECCQFSFVSIKPIGAMGEKKKTQTFELLCSQNFTILQQETYCIVSFQHCVAEFKVVEGGVMALYKQNWDTYIMISVLF